MSMQDMKEVRRIVTNILADSIQNVPTIITSFYRQRVSFNSSVSYDCFKEQAKKVVNESPIATEISQLQRQLAERRYEFLKSLININKSEMEEAREENDYDEDENDVKASDDFGVISDTISKVNSTLKARAEKQTKKVVEEYNDYLSKIESRTFDAYTKGMSADDFLAIVREEVKVLQTKAKNLAEDLKKNGYNDKND